MIHSFVEYRKYLNEDCSRNLGYPYSGLYNRFRYFFSLCLGYDSAIAFRYLKTLRRYELCKNCCTLPIISSILVLYYKIRHRILSIKYGIVIRPNEVGYGLRMAHVVGGHSN